ncbi:thermonuclease family protein [Psychrobacillus sp. FSL W7-1457]|uniref:thermonuclease family protein n=1 Tax=unclassified Psychrobacillus TaxID=2636677 RepID=UPI0030F96782
MKKWIMYILSLTILLGACSSIDQLVVEDENPITEQETSEKAEEAPQKESSEATSSTTHDVSKLEEFPLVSVIDGDTIKIKYNGANENVRFLLVDTPETNHPKLGEQPFGQEAKDFTKQLLKGQDTVFLEFDVSYRDKYNRLLAYIYTSDGKSLQEELLKQGLARVAYIYAPNTKHVDWFEAIQKKAQQQAIGIWSVENYVTNRGYDKDAVEEVKVVDKTNEEKKPNDITDCTIKGNINSKGEKIFHVPGQQYYEMTVAEEMFCSKEEAEAAGFRATQR